MDPAADALLSPTTKDAMVSPYNGYSPIPTDISYNNANSNASFLDSVTGYHQVLIPLHKQPIRGGNSPQYLLVRSNDSYDQKKAREETLCSDHVTPDN